MHDPINFTSKDSMYEAAAAILRGETVTSAITEVYRAKTAPVKKIISLIEDLDADELEDLLHSFAQLELDMSNESAGDDLFELAMLLNKAAKAWTNRKGN